MAAGTTVREFFARIGFNVDRGSLRAADRQLMAIRSGLAGLAGILVAGRVTQALVGAVRGTAELADEIKSTAARIGVTTQALQELRFAGGLANVDAGELQAGMRILARNAFEASRGSKEAAEGFRVLGVSVTDGQGRLKPTEQLLTELGDGFTRVRSETEKVAIAQKVFGRSGTALIPLLNQGSAAIAAQRREFGALGGMLGEELIELGDEFTDNQLRLRTAVQGVKNVLARALLPALNRTIMQTARWIAANRQWLGQGITATVKDFAAVLGSAARAIMEVVRFNFEFFKQLSPMQKALLGIVAVVLLLAAVFASPVLTMAAFLVLLGLVIEDFEVFRQGGDSAIGDLLKGVDELLTSWGKFGKVVRAVGESLSFVFESVLLTIGNVVELIGNLIEGDFGFAVETFVSRMSEIAGFVAPDAGMGFDPIGRGMQARGRAPMSNNMTSSINAPITINAAPGMSPEQIGTTVRAQLDEHQAGVMRQTREAFSPAR